MDIYIMVWACIMFMALELDRANISHAITDEFLPDLHMNTNCAWTYRDIQMIR